MIAQLEADRARESNIARNHRSKANNTVSTLIQRVDYSPNPAQIWTRVENDFVRLAESPTHDIRILSPQQALDAARQMEWRQIKDVAASFGRNTNDINRYREILGASLSLTLHEDGFTTPPFLTINQNKYQQLSELHQERDAIALVIDQPKIKEQLTLMPDLNALLDSFQQYSTVRLFLEENKVPYTLRSIPFFNTDLRDYLFGTKIPRMGLILRRATLSRWVNKHTSWYGSAECQIDEAISSNAAFVSSEKPPTGIENKARRIRWFINEIIAKELEIAQRDIALGHEYSLKEMFVPVNGTPLRVAADIDIPATLNLFADFSACPELIKSIVLKWLGVTGSPQTYHGLALAMYRDSAFKVMTKKRWIEGGLTFLENNLLNKPDEFPSWQRLTLSRRTILRQFRTLFQQVLKDQTKES